MRWISVSASGRAERIGGAVVVALGLIALVLALRWALVTLPDLEARLATERENHSRLAQAAAVTVADGNALSGETWTTIERVRAALAHAQAAARGLRAAVGVVGGLGVLGVVTGAWSIWLGARRATRG